MVEKTLIRDSIYPIEDFKIVVHFYDKNENLEVFKSMSIQGYNIKLK